MAMNSPIALLQTLHSLNMYDEGMLRRTYASIATIHEKCLKRGLKSDVIELLNECFIRHIDLLFTYLLNHKSIVDVRLVEDAILQIAKFMEVDDWRHKFLPKLIKPILERVIEPCNEVIFGKLLLKLLNIILEGSNNQYIEQFVTENEFLCCKLTDILSTCGDYIYQTIIMEILFHLCNNERIKKSAKQFFPEDENLQKCFLEIDRKNFEMDIRKFLNLINSMFKNVYSVVVDYVTIDQFKLIGKNAASFSERSDMIWIDFNKKSKSISILFDTKSTAILSEEPLSDSDLCETITIERENIKNFSYKKQKLYGNSQNLTYYILIFHLQGVIDSSITLFQHSKKFVIYINSKSTAKPVLTEVLPEILDIPSYDTETVLSQESEQQCKDTFYNPLLIKKNVYNKSGKMTSKSIASDKKSILSAHVMSNKSVVPIRDNMESNFNLTEEDAFHGNRYIATNLCIEKIKSTDENIESLLNYEEQNEQSNEDVVHDAVTVYAPKKIINNANEEEESILISENSLSSILTLASFEEHRELPVPYSFEEENQEKNDLSLVTRTNQKSKCPEEEIIDVQKLVEDVALSISFDECSLKDKKSVSLFSEEDTIEDVTSLKNSNDQLSQSYKKTCITISSQNDQALDIFSAETYILHSQRHEIEEASRKTENSEIAAQKLQNSSEKMQVFSKKPEVLSPEKSKISSETLDSVSKPDDIKAPSSALSTSAKLLSDLCTSSIEKISEAEAKNLQNSSEKLQVSSKKPEAFSPEKLKISGEDLDNLSKPDDNKVPSSTVSSSAKISETEALKDLMRANYFKKIPIVKLKYLQQDILEKELRKLKVAKDNTKVTLQKEKEKVFENLANEQVKAPTGKIKILQDIVLIEPKKPKPKTSNEANSNQRNFHRIEMMQTKDKIFEGVKEDVEISKNSLGKISTNFMKPSQAFSKIANLSGTTKNFEIADANNVKEDFEIGKNSLDKISANFAKSPETFDKISNLSRVSRNIESEVVNNIEENIEVVNNSFNKISTNFMKSPEAFDTIANPKNVENKDSKNAEEIIENYNSLTEDCNDISTKYSRISSTSRTSNKIFADDCNLSNKADTVLQQISNSLSNRNNDIEPTINLRNTIITSLTENTALSVINEDIEEDNDQEKHLNLTKEISFKKPILPVDVNKNFDKINNLSKTFTRDKKRKLYHYQDTSCLENDHQVPNESAAISFSTRSNSKVSKSSYRSRNYRKRNSSDLKANSSLYLFSINEKLLLAKTSSLASRSAIKSKNRKQKIQNYLQKGDEAVNEVRTYKRKRNSTSTPRAITKKTKKNEQNENLKPNEELDGAINRREEEPKKYLDKAKRSLLEAINKSLNESTNVLNDFYDTPKTTRKPVKKRNTVAFNDSEIPLIERDIIDDNEINRSLEKDVNVLGKLSKTPPPFPEDFDKNSQEFITLKNTLQTLVKLLMKVYPHNTDCSHLLNEINNICEKN